MKKTDFTDLVLMTLLSVVGSLTGCGDEGPVPRASKVLIVGGAEVTTKDPIRRSTVALLQPSGWQFCSGSLIGKRQVVTASHCLIDYQDEQLNVAFGSELHGGDGEDEAPAVELRAAVSYATNLHFDPDQLTSVHPSQPPNDIALITLADDAPSGFAPVKALTTKDKLKVGEALTLAGYGLTSAEDGTSGTLRKVQSRLEAVDNQAKELEFGGTPGKSACMGDSGGPAFVKRMGKLALVGVTSRGSPDCEGGGVYTDVRFFQSWVKKAEGGHDRS